MSLWKKRFTAVGFSSRLIKRWGAKRQTNTSEVSNGFKLLLSFRLRWVRTVGPALKIRREHRVGGVLSEISWFHGELHVVRFDLLLCWSVSLIRGCFSALHWRYSSEIDARDSYSVLTDYWRWIFYLFLFLFFF